MTNDGPTPQPTELSLYDNGAVSKNKTEFQTTPEARKEGLFN